MLKDGNYMFEFGMKLSIHRIFYRPDVLSDLMESSLSYSKWSEELSWSVFHSYFIQGQFFQSHHHYKHLDKSRRGIRNLATKMTKVLIEKIKETLPDLRQQVTNERTETR